MFFSYQNKGENESTHHCKQVYITYNKKKTAMQSKIHPKYLTKKRALQELQTTLRLDFIV